MAKNYTFSFMTKIIMILRSCSIKIFTYINILKLSNMHCCELNMNNFKDDFLNIQIFLHPQIPDFQILFKPYINGNIIYSAKNVPL